jgi:hypothetical protein
LFKVHAVVWCDWHSFYFFIFRLVLHHQGTFGVGDVCDWYLSLLFNWILEHKSKLIASLFSAGHDREHGPSDWYVSF